LHLTAERAKMIAQPPQKNRLMDTLSPQQRSERMSRIRGKNTKPELRVRRLLYSLGFRYRLHQRTLPGAPDIAFLSRRKVIFVHGCFWHQHAGCSIAHVPKSRREFWTSKLRRNCERDAANEQRLRELGWKSLIIWECQAGDLDVLAKRLEKFLA
jgi:DNA mismatch endonuclease (patch repair protein)